MRTMAELPTAKLIIVSILLAPAVRRCTPQSPQPAPPSAITPGKQNCSKQRVEVISLARGADSIRVVTLLADLYSKCPSYENGRDLADAEVDAGQFKSAIALVTSLLQQQDSADLHRILGKAADTQKNYKAAALEYQKAAEMDPSETNVFNFGTALFRLNHNAAIKILRFGVEKYPDSVRLRVALGTVLYGDGKSLEGAQLLCEAQELNPADPHPMELLAETEIIPPELAPRITTLLANLHKRYKQDGLILYDYTMVQSGRWSNSPDSPPPDFAASLEAALKLNPKLPQPYFQLSLIADQQKNYAEEIRLLKKAVELDPDKQEYRYRLAFAYRKSGDKAKFREELNQFQKLHAAAPNGQ